MNQVIQAPELEISGLRVSLQGTEILHGMDLTVRKGELVSLLGPSGCGKSTLLKTVAGLLDCQEGEIRIGGTSVRGIPTEQRGAVIVFQDLRLFPNMTAAGNIGFSLRLRGVSRKEQERRIRELLEIVHLPGLENRNVAHLSGGQMQRVALARALAAEPRLLLLDEPFSSLDEQLREEMRSFVLELHRKSEITIVMVTHDRQEALSMSDRIALIMDGTLLQEGPPEEIYTAPATREISDYLGGCSYLPGTVRDGVFVSPVWSIPASGYRDGPWLARVLPGMLELHPGDDWEVTAVHYLGDGRMVQLRKNGCTLTARTSRVLSVGDSCGLSLTPNQIVLYPDKKTAEPNCGTSIQNPKNI